MRIQVINPNTNRAMTEKIGRAARNAAREGTIIDSCCPEDGPESIEGHFDDAVSAVGVLELVREAERKGSCDAHIVACFGDPGLLAARELSTAPVIGIAEAAFHMATLISTKFAIVTTLSRTKIIAEKLLVEYGFHHRCTSIRCVDVPVLGLEAMGQRNLVMAIAEEALKAKQLEGAGAIVLGCGGMADLTRPLTEAIGLPIIEGLLAARELSTAPVIGIAEAAFHMATLISTKFAIVTTLSRTKIIAEKLLVEYGFHHRCTSIRCVDVPVLGLEAMGERNLVVAIAEEALKAKQLEGAGAIVLGCGGMADLTRPLTDAIGLPVIEGVSAAVKLAESLVDLGLKTSKHGDLAYPLPKQFSGKFSHFSK